jgi:indole-3-glycerol phosphate synthase
MPNNSSPSFLEQILFLKQKEIQNLYAKYGLEYFKSKLKQKPSNTSPFIFYQALSQPKLNLISEVKKASPSRGIIIKRLNPLKIADSYIKNNASALSVLTEKHFFKGSPKYIARIKNHFQIPILRKDFIVDPIQVYESAYLKANAILLIKAILTLQQCQELINLSYALGLDVLLEIHSEKEFHQIKSLKNLRIIGVNNRNLSTFKVDTNTVLKLAPQIKNHFKDHILIVAESGYKTVSKLQDLAQASLNAVLIGEGLIQNPSLLTYFKENNVKI